MINTKNVLISLTKNSSKLNLLKILPKKNFMTFLPSTKLNFNMQNIQNSNSLNNFFPLQSKNFSFDEFNEMRKNSQTQNSGVKGNRVYIGNLPWSVNLDEYINFFEQFGQVNREGTFIVNDEMGRSKGFGFVQFMKNDDASSLVESGENIEMGGRTLRINMANRQGERQRRNSPRGERVERERESFGQQPESNTLWVGNLNFDNNDTDIKQFFNEFGNTMVRMQIKENGLNRGFCHVEFEDVEKAKNAKENMNGRELNGRGVKLDFAAPRKD